MNPRDTIPLEALRAFAQRWRLAELSLFGSILRDDYSPGSDVDVLVAFAPGAGADLDQWMSMHDELAAIFPGRTIDLVERKAVLNPFRRHHILTTRRVVYAA